MYNYRAGFIISGGVFLVSLIVGLLGGAFFFGALLRALVFAGIFFGLTTGIHYLWNKFMQPGETSDTGSAPAIGRNVDYTVADDDLFGIHADESLPPGNASAESDDANDASGGLDALLTADAVDAETAELAGTDEEALEQNGDNVYIDNRVPIAGTPTVAKGAADYAFDIDMSDFTPAIPALGGGWEADKTAPPSGAEWSQTDPGAGIVDMSVAKKSGTKLDMYTNADGKEMAGAIKTLLKKDEG